MFGNHQEQLNDMDGNEGCLVESRRILKWMKAGSGIWKILHCLVSAVGAVGLGTGPVLETRLRDSTLSIIGNWPSIVMRFFDVLHMYWALIAVSSLDEGWLTMFLGQRSTRQVGSRKRTGCRGSAVLCLRYLNLQAITTEYEVDERRSEEGSYTQYVTFNPCWRGGVCVGRAAQGPAPPRCSGVSGATKPCANLTPTRVPMSCYQQQPGGRSFHLLP